ncbi:unnamed protein product, partial [Hapterophycus canaliculatus]
MENDHPRAMDFLRMDCRNVTSFFKKKGAQPAAARSLFDFVIDSDLQEEHQEDRFKEVLEKEFDEAEAFEEEYGSSSNNNNTGDGAGGGGGNARELAAELEIQDAVFMSSYIPRSLHEVDNVEDRQSRIEQEQREGGKGTAYAIAVSHMLKKDPPAHSTTANACAVVGDGGASGTDVRNKKSSSRKLGASSAGSAPASGGSLASPAVATPSRDGGDGGPPAAQEGRKPNSAEGVGEAVLGVRFARVGEDDEEGRQGEKRGGTAEEALLVDREVGGTDGDAGDGGGDGESDLDSASESGSGSDFSGSEDEDGGGEHTRRNWAERRARLRKDGMHGRRLPPPQAEEERASAKAEKREVS